MLGPEYIINPASTAIYDQFVKDKLPEVFVNDLNAVKGSLKGQKYIHATVLPENGIVAFVDESIHHKTPTPGPRTGSAHTLRTALREVYGDECTDAERAYREYKAASRYSVWTWSSYFKNKQAKQNAQAWWQILDGLEKMTKSGDQPLNRRELSTWLPPYFRDNTDVILEQASSDFTSVGYSHVVKGSVHTVPVRQREDKPLKRQMSEEDLSAYRATPTEGAKRSFFRTWVRAVPREQLRV
jgi:hypothetical protein